MSLASGVSALASRIAQEFNTVRGELAAGLAGKVDTSSAATVGYAATGSSSFSNTAYEALAGAGVTFVAPPSGKVVITVSGLMMNTVLGSGTNLAPQVMTGGTIGSGTTVLGLANDQYAASMNLQSWAITERTTLLTGLTPGSTYNVGLWRRVSGNTGWTAWERVIVVPQIR